MRSRVRADSLTVALGVVPPDCPQVDALEEPTLIPAACRAVRESLFVATGVDILSVGASEEYSFGGIASRSRFAIELLGE